MNTDDDLDPVDILEELGAARAYHLREAEKITARLKAAVRDAADAGVSEVEIASYTAVTRMTIRAWLGK